MIYQLVFAQGQMKKLVDAPTSEALQKFLRSRDIHPEVVYIVGEQNEPIMVNDLGEVFSERGAFIDWWSRQEERASNPPNNTYEGVVKGEMEWEVLLNDELFSHEESLKIANHSPDGFAWGYAGSGPAQLSLAILLNETGNPPLALARYQTFKNEVISQIPKDEGWALTSEAIREFFEGRK